MSSCIKKEKTETANSDSMSSATSRTNTDRDDSAAAFIELIPAVIERQYIRKFGEVASKHPNLVEKFILDSPSFKNLVENHKNFTFTKFYFIQDSGNSKMNLGMAFSNTNDYENISSDKKFILRNGKFQEDEKLKNKIDFYKSSLATQTGFNGKEATECVIYDTSDIIEYYQKRETAGKVISRLNLAMIYFFMAKDENNNDYNYDKSKHDRISFAVHAVYTNGSMDQGYDAGDLKP